MMITYYYRSHIQLLHFTKCRLYDLKYCMYENRKLTQVKLTQVNAGTMLSNIINILA